MDNSGIDIPGRIFICYRRQAAAFPAALIYGGLCEEFGPENVFKDVDNIRPGENFVRTLLNEVRGCEMLLAVITSDWAKVVDADGRVRLHDPRDYVRIEIETAFNNGMPVIPVLVGGAHMPHAEDLPESLASLAQLQAHEIDAMSPNRDVDRLVDYIRVLRRDIARGQSSTLIIAPVVSAISQPPPADPVVEVPPTTVPTPNAATTVTTPTTVPDRPPRSSRSRRVTFVASALVSASVLTVVLLNTAQSRNTGSGPFDSPTGSRSASSGTGPKIPQAAVGLPADAMVWRRAAGEADKTEILSLSKTGKVIETLVPATRDTLVGTVLSPDRRTFVYVRRAENHVSELHARATDGSGDDVILFTADGKGDCPYIRRPAWSSASLLAVPCGLEEEDVGPAALQIMELDGHIVRTLDNGFLGDPTFAANGTKVVYWRAEQAQSYSGGALYAVSTDRSTGREQLTESDGADADPIASPVGDSIVYRHRDPAGQMQIKMTSLASHEDSTALTNGPLDRDPSFSPDGRKVAFRRGHAESAQPWVVSVDDPEKNHAILEDAGGYSAPSWTAR